MANALTVVERSDECPDKYWVRTIVLSDGLTYRHAARGETEESFKRLADMWEYDLLFKLNGGEIY